MVKVCILSGFLICLSQQSTLHCQIAGANREITPLLIFCFTAKPEKALYYTQTRQAHTHKPNQLITQLWVDSRMAKCKSRVWGGRSNILSI